MDRGTLVKVRRSRLLKCADRGDTVLGDALGPMSETSPVDSRKCVVAANDSMDVLTKALSNCQEQLRLAEQQLEERLSRSRKYPVRRHP